MIKDLSVWISLLFQLTCLNIPGVLADESRTALIATGCVAGGLLLIAIVIIGVYCAFKHIRKREKKPLPTINGDYFNAGMYRVPTETPVDTPVRAPSEVSPKTKAYTHHAAHARTRQPLTFYTLRAEPRAMMDAPGMIPIGPTQSYRGPPPIGRPVIFLDWAGSKGQFGHFMSPNRHFIYPNGGTMYPYANGGAPLIDQETDEKRDANRRRSSKSTKKHKSRSKSRSRSRDPERSSRRSSHDEAPIVAEPGDIILQAKKEDLQPFVPTGKRKHSHDSNNNPLAYHFVNPLATEYITATNQSNFVPEGGRYSITQVPTSRPQQPSNGRGNFPEPVLQERSMNFSDEDADDEGAGDVKEIPFVQGPNVFSDHARVSHVQRSESLSSTPREDYSITPQASLIRKDSGPGSNMGDVALRNQSRQEITSSHRQDPTLARPPTPPLPHTRARTPPYDGSLPISNRNDLYLAQRNTGGVRAPSPPPDMSSSSSDEEDAPYKYQQAVRPPTPPPLPHQFGSPKPTSSIQNTAKTTNSSMDIDDILKLGDAPRKPSLVESHSTGSESSSELPFMAELRKRQKSVDAPIPAESAFRAVRSTISTSSHGESDSESPVRPSRLGFGHRPSTVQFANDPPEIIPDQDVPESPRSPETEDILSFNDAPPPPPPPTLR